MTDDQAATTSEVSGVEVDPFEQALLKLAPIHAHVEHRNGLPERVQQFLTVLTADPGDPLLSEIPPMLRVQWSTKSGRWLIDVMRCPAHDDEHYVVEVDGPGTVIRRSHMSVDEAMDLFTAVGVFAPGEDPVDEEHDGKVDDDPLLTRLIPLLPAPERTFIERPAGIPEWLEAALRRSGAVTVIEKSSGLKFRVSWSTIDGCWTVAAGIIADGDDELYSVRVHGPGVDVRRDGATVDQAIAAITMLLPTETVPA